MFNEKSPLYFVKDKAILKEKETDKLNYIIDYLQNYSKVEILIRGHTESIGRPQNELKLSKKRAEYIKKTFMKKYSEEVFIFKTRGFGATKFAVRNAAKKERYLNRRVEFKVISAKAK